MRKKEQISASPEWRFLVSGFEGSDLEFVIGASQPVQAEFINMSFANTSSHHCAPYITSCCCYELLSQSGFEPLDCGQPFNSLPARIEWNTFP